MIRTHQNLLNKISFHLFQCTLNTKSETVYLVSRIKKDEES